MSFILSLKGLSIYDTCFLTSFSVICRDTKFSMVPAVLMGDFNIVIDPKLDRIRSDTIAGMRELTPFGRILQETAFVDLWRSKHLYVRQYSCHPSTYYSLSRIDLILGNPLAQNVTSRVEYLLRCISDHPVLLMLKIPGADRVSSPSWKLNPFWLSVIDV